MRKTIVTLEHAEPGPTTRNYTEEYTSIIQRPDFADQLRDSLAVFGIWGGIYTEPAIRRFRWSDPANDYTLIVSPVTADQVQRLRQIIPALYLMYLRGVSTGAVEVETRHGIGIDPTTGE